MACSLGRFPAKTSLIIHRQLPAVQLSDGKSVEIRDKEITYNTCREIRALFTVQSGCSRQNVSILSELQTSIWFRPGIRSALSLRLMFIETARDLNARLILPVFCLIFLFYWYICLSTSRGTGCLMTVQCTLSAFS